MSKADEYVEKVVTDSYKRELDQEENVVRSLPFFATSLGILATALGLARTAIGPFALSGIQLAIYTTLALTAVSILLVLAFLVQAIRPRDFKNPMTEQDLISYRSDPDAFTRPLTRTSRRWKPPSPMICDRKCQARSRKPREWFERTTSSACKPEAGA